MAISFVAAGTVATGTNPTVDVPAGYAAEDLLVIVTTGTATPTTPSGWAQRYAQGAGRYITILTKYASSSESSVALTLTGTTSKAVMVAYRGAGSWDILATVNTGTSTSAATLSQTTTYANDYVISIFTRTTGTSSFTTPASTTSRVNSGSTASVNGLLIVDELKATAGATTARTSTITSGAWAAISISFVPTRTLYWAGGTGTWDTSTTGDWANTSGGSTTGIKPPVLSENVIINSSSGTGTITITGGVCNNLTITSPSLSLTIAAGSTLSVYGNYSESGGPGGLVNNAWTLTFASTTAGNTITGDPYFAGIAVVFDGVGGGWSNGSSTQISFTTAGSITLTRGSLDITSCLVTVGAFNSSNTNTRTLTLGASGRIFLTGSGTPWNFATSTNLTFTQSANNSVIAMYTSTGTFAGGGLTYSEVLMNQGNSGTISGSNTFSFLSWNVTGTTNKTLSLTSGTTQTIVNNFVIYSDSTTNSLRASTSSAATIAKSGGGQVVVYNVDVRYITGSPASSVYVSNGVDGGNNTNVGFGDYTARYWVGGTANWTSTNAAPWALTSGGTSGAPAPFYFNSSIYNDVYFNANSNTGTNAFTVTVTDTATFRDFTVSGLDGNMTLACGSNSLYLYRNWSSNVTGPSITMTGTGSLLIYGTGSQNFAASGVSIPLAITRNDASSSIVLQSNLTTTSTIDIPNFDNSGNYNVTCTRFIPFGTSGTITLGNGTYTITGVGSVWSVNSGHTLNANSSTINITDTSTSAKTFAGGGKTYNNVTFGSGGGVCTYTISGSNTFSTLASNKTSAYTLSLTAGTTQTVTTWNVNGTSGNVLTLGSTTTSAATITKAGGGTAIIDYATISYITGSPAATWYATNSTNGGNNTNITFGAPVTSTGNMFMLF